MSHFYPIGTPNKPWQQKEKEFWLAQAEVKREYKTQVIYKLEALSDFFKVSQYGNLPINPHRYPLYALTSKNWQDDKPTVLITGGVHGYETSGVQGAILFAKEYAIKYVEHFNIIILPCISPWGYETINRWNPNAVDPNRSFYDKSPSEEAAQAMAFVKSLNVDILAHIDLHETTDSDEEEFRPALAARDGKAYSEGTIPDGFYLVGDSDMPQPDFQKAIIDSVRKVTHIAPPEGDGQILSKPVEQDGVINYPTKELGLCAGFTDRIYCTTTEVYPDSPKVTDKECNLAQVAAITGGLDYLISIG
ncbi:M14 family metallopeptidase [Parashewanella tropica]|uniref:M14 family metallopeptidase n=1 Tax=Parashewanella tropica TaxID=2547970 RepID=UPI001C552C97|nr:M14 family metallocarboxypeptidase [Parashewanella tropica]